MGLAKHHTPQNCKMHQIDGTIASAALLLLPALLAINQRVLRPSCHGAHIVQRSPEYLPRLPMHTPQGHGCSKTHLACMPEECHCQLTCLACPCTPSLRSRVLQHHTSHACQMSATGS
jgi:hypothetical protein